MVIKNIPILKNQLEKFARFSHDLAMLVAHLERADAEYRERYIHSVQLAAEFEQSLTSIKECLNRVAQRQVNEREYWQAQLHQQSLEIKLLKREKERLLQSQGASSTKGEIKS